MSRNSRGLSVRDLVTSSATVIGFSLTALSFLAGLGPGRSDIVGRASALLVVAVLSFVATILVALAMISFGRSRLWNLAIGVYSAGWVSTGLLITYLTVKLGYGLDFFSISIPPLSADQLSIVVALGSAGLSAFLSVLLARAFGAGRLTSALRGLLPSYEQIARKEEIPNLMLAFLDDAITLEKRIRELSEAVFHIERPYSKPLSMIINELQRKNILPPDFTRQLNLVSRARNLVVHGAFVPDETLAFARLAARDATERLEQIAREYSKARGKGPPSPTEET